MEKGRSKWPSHIDSLLASIGTAVGLSNIYGFPILAYRVNSYKKYSLSQCGCNSYFKIRLILLWSERGRIILHPLLDLHSYLSLSHTLPGFNLGAVCSTGVYLSLENCTNF